MTQDFYRKLVEELLAEEVDVDVSGLVDETGSGGDAALGPDRDTASAQDAAFGPDRDTASGQDAAPHPDRDTASGQDAAPNPNRDTASGQDEPEIEPGSAHDGSASGQISRGSSSVVHGARQRVRCDGEPARNTQRRIYENNSNPVAAEHSFSDFSCPGVVMPDRMPRVAFFLRVYMPWPFDDIAEPVL